MAATTAAMRARDATNIVTTLSLEKCGVSRVSRVAEATFDEDGRRLMK